MILGLHPPCVELFASSSEAWAGGALAVEARLLLALGLVSAATIVAASAAEALGLALVRGAMLGYWVSASQLSCRSPRTAPTVVAKRLNSRKGGPPDTRRVLERGEWLSGSR